MIRQPSNHNPLYTFIVGNPTPKLSLYMKRVIQFINEHSELKWTFHTPKYKYIPARCVAYNPFIKMPRLWLYRIMENAMSRIPEQEDDGESYFIIESKSKWFMYTRLYFRVQNYFFYSNWNKRLVQVIDLWFLLSIRWGIDAYFVWFNLIFSVALF